MTEKRKVADNLYVYTRDSGREYYVFRGTVDGKRIDRTVGPVSEMSIKEAKKAVGLLLNAPVAETKKDTFGDLMIPAIDGIAGIKLWKYERAHQQWISMLSTYALPVLRKKRVEEITRQDIIDVLEPIWRTKTETASRVQQRLEAVFDWLITREYRTGYNPATWRGNLSLFLPQKSKVSRVQHQTAPTIEELRKIVKHCTKNRCAVSGLVLFVIATVCRVTEAREAKMEEIVDGVWTMPRDRRKVDKEEAHRVPISSMAQLGLSMSNGKVYIWEGVYCGKPVALDTPRLKIVSICPRDGKQQITIHGVRSTFRDWCAENGVPDVEAEKALDHEWGNSTTTAYYRSDLLEKRRLLMQRWADVLTDAGEKAGAK